MIKENDIKKLPDTAKVIIADKEKEIKDQAYYLNNISIKDKINMEKVNFNSEVYYGIRNLIEREKPIASLCTREEDMPTLVEKVLNKIEFQDYVGKIELNASVKSSITEWMRSADKNVFSEELKDIVEVIQLSKDDMSKILLVEASSDKKFKFMIDENAETLTYSMTGGIGILTNHIFLEIKNKVFGEEVYSNLYVNSGDRLCQGISTKFGNSKNKDFVRDLIGEYKNTIIKKQGTPIEAPRYVIESLNKTNNSWMTLKIWEDIILDLIFANENDIRLENYVSKDFKDNNVLEPVKDKFSEGIQSIKNKFTNREKTEIEEDIQDGFEEIKNKVTGPSTTKIRDLFDLNKIKIDKTIKSSDKTPTKRIKECRFMHLTDVNFENRDKFTDMLYSIQKYDENIFNPNTIAPMLATLESNKDEILQIINKTRVTVNYNPEYFDYVSHYGNEILTRIDILNKFIKDEINRRIKIQENKKMKEKMERRLVQQELDRKLHEQSEDMDLIDDINDNEEDIKGDIEDNNIDQIENENVQVDTDNNFEDTIILKPSDIETEINKSE